MTERDGSSRDRGDWGADPELRTLLRTGDPARSLPPLSPDDLACLVDSAIAADEPVRSAAPGARRTRRSWVPAAVAAAVLVVAGVGVWSVTGSDDTAAPIADGPSSVTPAPTGSPSATASASGPTVLAAPDITSTRCMAPNVDVLQMQEIAFGGSVTAIDGNVVTLAPATVYTGDVGDTVQIQAPGPEMTSLLSAVSFEVGKTYLVSASQGQVTLCGFSAQDTPALRTLYQQAFGG